METSTTAIETAFGRTTKVLDAINAGGTGQAEVAQMHAAQPWDCIAVGQTYVLDRIKNERAADDAIRPVD